MEWLANGSFQTWCVDVVTNNAKILACIYGVLKYFAVTTGHADENKILDLFKK